MPGLVELPGLGELPGIWPTVTAGVAMTLPRAMGELRQGWWYG